MADNAIAEKKPGVDVLYWAAQALLTWTIASRVGSAPAYLQYSAPLQILAYLILFNAAGILFHHFAVRPLKPGFSRIVWILFGIAGLYLYLVSFYPVLDLSGDNAGYLSRARAIMEGKGFRNIWLPSEPYEATLKGIGFSLLNIPFIAVFGLDRYPGLKILEMVSLFGGLWFLFKFFEPKIGRPTAFLLTFLTGLHSQIVHFSSIIMTESVSFFLLFFVLWLTDRFAAGERKTDWRSVAAAAGIGVLAVFAFTVREAMMALVAVLPLYLLLRKRWLEALGAALTILLCLAVYAATAQHLKDLNAAAGLASAAQSGSAPTSLLVHYVQLLERTLKALNVKSFWDAILVLTQKVAGDPDRYDYAKILPNLLVLAVCLTGVAARIAARTRSLMYDLFAGLLVVVVILTWDVQTDYVVFSRYFYPLIPIVLVYFLLGAKFVAEKAARMKFLTPALVLLVTAGVLSGFFFRMNTNAVYAGKHPYDPAVVNFIEACRWIRQNTPKDAIIADRKSTLGFIWADRKSIHYFNDMIYTRYDNYSAKFEADTLDYYRSHGISYVILDAFSPDAYYKILPVVRNNPKFFVPVYQTRDPATWVLRFVPVSH